MSELISASAPSALRPRSQVFQTLDGMRGVAAIIVAISHCGDLFGFHPQSAFLAVDFFFCLSGFVIFHSYHTKFEQGLGPLRFLLQRVIRLYPLYILGCAVMLFTYVGAGVLHVGPKLPLIDGAAFVAFGATFLPTPALFHPWAKHIFPLNFPCWSLFFELVANLLFALIYGLIQVRGRLIALVALGAVSLVAAAFSWGSIDYGSMTDDMIVGFCRVLFSFFAGVLIYQVGQRFRLSGPLVIVGLYLVLLLALLAPQPLSGPVYQLACALVLFPALVILGAAIEPNGVLKRISAFLGLISYPLYCIHAPAVFVLTRLWPKLHHGHELGASPLVGTVFMIAIIGLSAGAALVYDNPTRRFLMQRLPKPRPRPIPSAA